jgi:S-adenosylmethionine uptake transporter
MPPIASLSGNSRGVLFMLASTVSFIVSDTFVKLASADFAAGQILLVRSLMTAPLMAMIAWRQGAFVNIRGMAERFIGLRMIGEIGASALYLSALVRMDIANATAILQLTPLASTAAAALFLGEKVGFRRWSAIVIGFLAVLLIVRPGVAGFSGWSVLALSAVGFVVLRDLSSRFLPATTQPLAVSALSLSVLAPLGLAMLPLETWGPLTTAAVLHCAASGVFIACGFVFITLAMRNGELSVVGPFRYAILLWAVIIQVAVFGIWPDALTLVGGAILVATGLYMLYRERQTKVARQAAGS